MTEHSASTPPPEREPAPHSESATVQSPIWPHPGYSAPPAAPAGPPAPPPPSGPPAPPGQGWYGVPPASYGPPVPSAPPASPPRAGRTVATGLLALLLAGGGGLIGGLIVHATDTRSGRKTRGPVRVLDRGPAKSLAIVVGLAGLDAWLQLGRPA